MPSIVFLFFFFGFVVVVFLEISGRAIVSINHFSGATNLLTNWLTL